MRLKRSDLEMLMSYVDKERPATIDITKKDNMADALIGISFSFTDAEGRECEVVLYNADLNIAPDLKKTMKLRSRLKVVKPESDN